MFMHKGTVTTLPTASVDKATATTIGFIIGTGEKIRNIGGAALTYTAALVLYVPMVLMNMPSACNGAFIAKSDPVDSMLTIPTTKSIFPVRSSAQMRLGASPSIL